MRFGTRFALGCRFGACTCSVLLLYIGHYHCIYISYQGLVQLMYVLSEVTGYNYRLLCK